MSSLLPSWLLLMLVAVVIVVCAALLLMVKVPLRYNLRNLTVRWRTTALTTCAFTLVVGLLTVMLAFLNGMARLADGSAQPGNVIVLQKGATDEIWSELKRDDVGNVDLQPGVLRGSRELYLIASQEGPRQPGHPPRRRYLQVRGIDDPHAAADVHGLTLYPGGSWFSDAGVDERGIQAILGEGIAQELGRDVNKKRLEVGDRFELGPDRAVVVGIMQSAGRTFSSEIWAKLSRVGPMFGKEHTLTTVVLRTGGPADAARVAQQVSETKTAYLKGETETSYYASLGATNRQFVLVIGLVALMMALGGMFGVMNTMFAAISQRTKDIGVLRVLGFRRRQILISFLLESVTIALIGGLIGCGLGYLVNGWTVTSIVNAGEAGGKSVILKLVVDTGILSIGLCFSALMGVLGGVLPAVSAMLLKPLEAMK